MRSGDSSIYKPTYATFCDVGGQVLFQDGPLGLGGLQLNVLLLQHCLEVRHLPLDKRDFLLDLQMRTWCK